MAITTLPPAPDRDDPINFADEADAWVAALALFTTEANALQTDVNAKQTAAATSASDASTYATNASNSAAAAAGSAVTAASAASAPLWVSGTNYAIYAAAMSPTNLLSYRARSALNPSTVDPATDTANWRLLNGITFVSVVAGTSATAVAGGHYILTNGSATTVTFPSAAFSGDEIWVTVANDIDTNVINRGSLTIMGLPQNFNIDQKYVTVKFRYVNTTWRLI